MAKTIQWFPGHMTKAMRDMEEKRELCDDVLITDVYKRQEIQYYKDFFEDFDEEKAKTMIAELGVNPTQKVRSLSKGTKEKLGLLLTLARNAKLFILDEPIAGVDPAARDYILKTIVSHKNADATMIICTHLIGDIEPLLDYVLFLQNGKVVLQGGANEIRKGEGKTIDQLFREVFRW